MNKSRIFVPNNPLTMRICPELAEEIGLNESIVLLQLEFLISISTTEERDGTNWTYQSLRDLCEKYFPWWCIDTIRRTIKNLVEKELIIVGNYNKRKGDMTNWYALNPV